MTIVTIASSDAVMRAAPSPDPAVLARHNVRVTGHGERPIVFAHGFGCDQHMWRAVAPAFEDRWRVVRFDHAGAGAADPAAYDPVRHARLDGYAADLAAILEALDLRDAVLVGHSVSATIAMLAALRAPERVGRLVMVGPSPCYRNDPPDYEGGFSELDLAGLLELMAQNYVAWADALAPTIVGTVALTGAAVELRDGICAMRPEVALAFARATFLEDHRETATRVGVPALILQCSADRIAPVTVGDWLHRNMAHATFHQLAATGHCPHMTHPDETVAAIRGWLEPGPSAAAG